MVCIIDDREDVWNFAPNLVTVKPYRFFTGTGDINDPFANKESDEGPKETEKNPLVDKNSSENDPNDNAGKNDEKTAKGANKEKESGDNGLRVIEEDETKKDVEDTASEKETMDKGKGARLSDVGKMNYIVVMWFVKDYLSFRTITG